MDAFKCGHSTGPENITYRGGRIRCRICVKSQDAANNARTRQKEREARKGKVCLLQEIWK